MNFSELRFWGLLGVGLLVIVVLRQAIPRFRDVRHPFDRVSLGVLSVFLLGCVSWLTFIIFTAVLILTYFGLFLIQKYGNFSKWWLVILIPLQLAPLLYYKYAYFIGSEILGADVPRLRDLLIPIGISFYTFQEVGFVIDTLVARKPLPRFIDCLNFISFFPQIVAGPIERRGNLLPQMESFRFRWLPQGIDDGIGWIVVGLFLKCCLADNLAEHFDRRSLDNPFLIWKANILFGLRIYYDFAGYSLVAVGLGRCLGVNLTLNFESPYCSCSVIEFWRRWHITLSQWFRDYVYVPLGGGRVPWWALNVGIVFLVSGIWHGAGWNFIIWGLLHGIFLIFNRLFGSTKCPPQLGWGLTILFVFYTWLCFYEVRPDALAAKIAAISSPAAYNLPHWEAFVADLLSKNAVVLFAFLLLSCLTFFLEWLSLRRKLEPYALMRQPLILCIMVVLIVWLTPGIANDFIYFAF